MDLSSAAVICGQGGNYFDARANLEDDGGFSTFCRMVERVKTNVEVSRLEAAVAVGGKETLASGHPIRGMVDTVLVFLVGVACLSV